LRHRGVCLAQQNSLDPRVLSGCFRDSNIDLGTDLFVLVISTIIAQDHCTDS